MKFLPLFFVVFLAIVSVAFSAPRPQSKDITNASPLPPSNFQPEFDEIVVESALNVRRKSKERQSRNSKQASTTTDKASSTTTGGGTPAAT